MNKRLHPLYQAYVAADDAWSEEIRAEAQRRKMWPGDLRFRPEAKSLPSYPAFCHARDAWHAAGRPIAVANG